MNLSHAAGHHDTRHDETKHLPVEHREEHFLSEHKEEVRPHHHAIDPDSAMTRTTGLLIALNAVIGIGGFILNFDIGYTGAVLVMEPFNRAFGTCAIAPGETAPVCALSATQQSLGSSIYLIFLALGAAGSGVSSHYFGPKGALQVGCVLVSIGAAGMVGSAGNFVGYVASKCIGAVGLGHVQNMGVIYGVECSPPAKRGLLVCLFTVGATIGNLVATAVCAGSQTIPNDWSWRIPIILQIPTAALFGFGLFSFPQSPRWLLTKGKTDQAHRSFGRLYRSDPFGEDVSRQVVDTQAAIDEEKELSASTNWTEIFHRNFRRRTIIATAINCCAALSGSFFIFSYAALFLHSVGVGSPIDISVIINSCVVIGGLTGPFWVEFLGRRRAIITGFLGMMACMLVFSATSTGLGGVNNASAASRDVLVAFLCVWAFCFGAFISSTQFLASSEMHAVRHRSYGQAFASLVANLIAFGSSFWGPYMLNPDYGNMGTNVGYFYFALETISLCILFTIVPECGRLTLEQIDEYFLSSRKAWRTSLARNKRIAKREIDVKDD